MFSVKNTDNRCFIYYAVLCFFANASDTSFLSFCLAVL